MGFTLWVLTQPGAPVLGMPAAALMLILLPAFYQPAPLQGGPACLACSASELHFEAKGGERGCQGFCEQGLSSPWREHLGAPVSVLVPPSSGGWTPRPMLAAPAKTQRAKAISSPI